MKLLALALALAVLCFIAEIDGRRQTGIFDFFKPLKSHESHENKGGSKKPNVCVYREYKLLYSSKKKHEHHCENLLTRCPLLPWKMCKEKRCTTKYTTKHDLTLTTDRKARKVTACCPGWGKKSRRASIRSRGCTKNVTCLTISQYIPGPCAAKREAELKKNREIYHLSKPATTIPNYPLTVANIFDFLAFPLLNITLPQLVGLMRQNPIDYGLTNTYLGMIQRNDKTVEEWNNEHELDFTEYSEYTELLDKFRQVQPTDHFTFTFDGNHGDYKDIIKDEVWKNDDVFVDQRLAGLNVFALRKLDEKEYLEKCLQFNADIDEAISNAAGHKTTMSEMVRRGLVFIVDYPLLYNLTNVADLTDRNTSDSRNMRPSTSPIAIFLSVRNWVKEKYELKAVGIQVEFDAASPLVTPANGSKWLMAKLEIQRADFDQVEIIEHLLKHHYLMDAIIVTMFRTLSSDHPIHEILKYHSRGTLMTNSASLKALLAPGGKSHDLMAIGHIGSVELLNRAHELFTWKETDFGQYLQSRGVDNTETLPYFPFRDDVLLVWGVVKNMVKNYVNIYYKNDDFVAQDKELQNFANELSAEGTGEHGGLGHVKYFPFKISTKLQLADTLSRIIFTPIRHHAANYPVSYYGGFVPNMPTKIYDDPRVAPGDYNIHRLPQSHVASIQVGLAMTLGTLRYDTLFDYGPGLRDKQAQSLLNTVYHQHLPAIDKIINARNKKRFDENRLTYPYFLSQYMPNSIQT